MLYEVPECASEAGRNEVGGVSEEDCRFLGRLRVTPFSLVDNQTGNCEGSRNTYHVVYNFDCLADRACLEAHVGHSCD